MSTKSPKAVADTGSFDMEPSKENVELPAEPPAPPAPEPLAAPEEPTPTPAGKLLEDLKGAGLSDVNHLTILKTLGIADLDGLSKKSAKELEEVSGDRGHACAVAFARKYGDGKSPKRP